MYKKLEIENKQLASFSVSNYILNVVLPKCTIVHGEVVTSTYFQIALTINNSKEVVNWKKSKSWIGLRTIAKTTGFSLRAIGIAVNFLKELNLIEQTYHGKLKMFELKNNNIVNVEEMIEFNNYIEHKLLLKAKSKGPIKEKFKLLNEKFEIYSHPQNLFLLKKTWMQDINQIRSTLSTAESIYRGSTLFVVNLLNNQQIEFKNDKEVSDNNITISERDRSLMIGCSQSTLNRYILAFENANIITRKKKSGGAHQIELNFDLIRKENSKGMVNDKMENEKIICPICEREIKTEESFNRHLSMMKDAQHYELSEIRKKNGTTDYKTTINYLYPENKEKIDALKGRTKKEIREEREEEMANQKQLNGFEDIPSTSKKSFEDTAPGLLTYFYDLNGQKSPNWAKECFQVKNLLVRKNQPLTSEEVRIVLTFMNRKGYMDIRFLTTSVTEALHEYQLLQEVDKDGTVPFLVKRFYNGFNMDINLQTFVRDVRKVKETMNSGLTFEQTKIVIDYMISTKCNNINFIGTSRNDALMKHQGKGVNMSNDNINKFNNNPSFFDQDFLNILKDELASGRTRLNKVEDKHKEGAIKVAQELFLRRKFSTKFTGFEWAWRVGLSLDKRMYDLACRELHKKTYIEGLIESGTLKPEQEKSYIQLKQKYETWLQEQHDFFRSSQMMFNQK
ncbi:gp224 [Bacillus phage G]|uniref:Gp224 n=1 Tax=Bacillus phage G TaxID=2884420 RepID=G3M9W5_9CAUD|nr:gp224 [Bacillus phage G]AEO93483.1 gp224 [Bacillus phage G]